MVRRAVFGHTAAIMNLIALPAALSGFPTETNTLAMALLVGVLVTAFTLRTERSEK